jgi:hypothetical protein
MNHREGEPELKRVVYERDPRWREVQDECIAPTPEMTVCAPERRPTALALKCWQNMKAMGFFERRRKRR